MILKGAGSAEMVFSEVAKSEWDMASLGYLAVLVINNDQDGDIFMHWYNYF